MKCVFEICILYIRHDFVVYWFSEICILVYQTLCYRALQMTIFCWKQTVLFFWRSEIYKSSFAANLKTAISWCVNGHISDVNNVFLMNVTKLPRAKTFLKMSAIVKANKGWDRTIYLFSWYTGLHTQKAYTDSGTSPMQILLLLAPVYMHFAWKLQLLTQCVHLSIRTPKV